MWFKKGWYFNNCFFWISIAKDLWYINIPDGRHYFYLSLSKTESENFKAMAIHVFNLKIAFMKLK